MAMAPPTILSGPMIGWMVDLIDSQMSEAFWLIQSVRPPSPVAPEKPSFLATQSNAWPAASLIAFRPSQIVLPTDEMTSQAPPRIDFSASNAGAKTKVPTLVMMSFTVEKKASMPLTAGLFMKREPRSRRALMPATKASHEAHLLANRPAIVSALNAVVIVLQAPPRSTPLRPSEPRKLCTALVTAFLMS